MAIGRAKPCRYATNCAGVARNYAIHSVLARTPALYKWPKRYSRAIFCKEYSAGVETYPYSRAIPAIYNVLARTPALYKTKKTTIL